MDSTNPNPTSRAAFDSLTADIVVAEEGGVTTLHPADAEVLRQFIAACRRATPKGRTAPDTGESEG